jgi:hypothetical protein
MDIFQKLTILTFITSSITLILVTVAVVPHIKHGMTLIRDAFLWATFVLVVAFAGWVGFQRLPLPDSRPWKGLVPGETKVHAAARTGPISADDPFYIAPANE